MDSVMQGKELTRPGKDLAYIFFKIRAYRDKATRRSWQRRARLALADRTDLTPAERHEIMCVWSRSDCHLIDSPAMSKLLQRPHIQFEGTTPAVRVTRAKFTSDGQKKERPKSCPYFPRVATNEDFFIAQHRPLKLKNLTSLPAVSGHGYLWHH